MTDLGHVSWLSLPDGWQPKIFSEEGRTYLDPGSLQQLDFFSQRGGHDTELSTWPFGC